MGESWEARSLLPTSDCQRKEEAEEADGLEAFHLYLGSHTLLAYINSGKLLLDGCTS